MGLADRPERTRLGGRSRNSGGVVRENPNEGAGQGCARPMSEPSLQHRVWVSRFNRTSRNHRLHWLAWLLSLWLSGLGHSENRHCASPLSRRSPGGFVRARFLSGGEGEGRGHPWRHPLISRFSNTESRNLPYFRVLSTRPATGNLHLVNWRLVRQSMRCPPPFQPRLLHGHPSPRLKCP